MDKRSMCILADWEAREKPTLCKIVSVLGKERKRQEITKRVERSGAGDWKKSLAVSPIHTIVLTPCKRPWTPKQYESILIIIMLCY